MSGRVCREGNRPPLGEGPAVTLIEALSGLDGVDGVECLEGGRLD